MICIVIKGPTFEEAQDQLAQAILQANMIELRLDLFSNIDLASLKRLRTLCHLPMIFTLRSRLQGGSYQQSEKERLATLFTFLEAKPDYLDLEWNISASFISCVRQAYPSLRLIISYHDMIKTPSHKDLDALYEKMRRIPARFYKIAVTATTILDTLRFLCWKKEQDAQLIGICMGFQGQISRILSPLFGSPFTYASLDDTQTTAKGQLTAQTLIQTYRYFSLNQDTQLYGLIGDPVSKSISEITHNGFFGCAEFHAVYVKMDVKKEELQEFLKLAKQLPFQGLSVTMPLKEAICEVIEEIDLEAQRIGAVNTLILREGRWKGCNTDGKGALNAVEKYKTIANQRVILIGAGGAAKAIAFEAKRRGAHVILFNRKEEKAQDIALKIGCDVGKIEEIQKSLEEEGAVLINCTPVDMPFPIHFLRPKTLVMDINTKTIVSSLFSFALENDCTLIYGYEMFVEQALGQFRLWGFDSQVIQHYATDLVEKSKDCLLSSP